jgi:hypothetical protein
MRSRRARSSPRMRPDEWPARRAAMVALGLMLGYFVVDNHVPLYPWNNLADGAAVAFHTGRVGAGPSYDLGSGAGDPLGHYRRRGLDGRVAAAPAAAVVAALPPSARRRCTGTSAGTGRVATRRRCASSPAAGGGRCRIWSTWYCSSSRLPPRCSPCEQPYACGRARRLRPDPRMLPAGRRGRRLPRGAAASLSAVRKRRLWGAGPMARGCCACRSMRAIVKGRPDLR